MAEAASHLRLLGSDPPRRGVGEVGEFHQINRVLPRDQRVLSLDPRCPVREAIAQLRDREYSQAPVVADDLVIGVFSFRGFAREVGELELKDWNQRKAAPADLEVQDCLEEFQFVRVTDDLSSAFDALDRDNGVLVGAADQLLGILTPMDVLRYFHEIASPFVLMSEIEMTLRRLISHVLAHEEIADMARLCLTGVNNSREVPTTLESMTFGDYEALIGYGATWPRMQPVFGSNRIHTKTRLGAIGRIRNDIMHFRARPEPRTQRDLTLHRNWCLSRVKMLEARNRKEPSA
jgi:predicted transcriptional regulator